MGQHVVGGHGVILDQAAVRRAGQLGKTALLGNRPATL
jgi:hypothetical protein